MPLRGESSGRVNPRIGRYCLTNKPLVSILTPTYNHQRFLGDCLRSVRSQSYAHWEHIIVDDGSTDRSKEVASSFIDSRTHWIEQDHHGTLALGDTYNEALRHASGEFVAILEGDDSWPPDKLETQVAIHGSEHVLLTWGRGLLIDETSARIGTTRPIRSQANQAMFRRADLLPRLILENFIVPSSGIVIRRDALERIQGFRQVAGVGYTDLPTWLTLCCEMKESEMFVYLNREVVRYRIHPGQASNDYLKMLAFAATVGARFVDDLTPNQASELGLDMNDLRKAVMLLRAKREIANREWKTAFKMTQGCWSSNDRFLRLGLLEASASILLHIDLARTSSQVQRRLPSSAGFWKRIWKLGARETSQGLRPLRSYGKGIERQTRMECPSCGGSSRVGTPIQGWGFWRTCLNCTLEFADPHVIAEGPAKLFQDAYLGKKDFVAMDDFAARIAIREALRETPQLWFWTPAFNLVFEWLRRNVADGSVVLDVGCGMGFVMLALKRAGYRPVGVDVAEEAVRANTRDGFAVWQGTVETVPIRWATPDAVLSLFMLHHVENPRAFLTAIKSKWPQALLAVAVYGPSNQDPVRSRPPRTLSRWNAKSLNVALNQAGYSSVIREVRSTGVEQPFVRKIQQALNWTALPKWVYRFAKQIEIAFAPMLLVPFQRDSFVMLALAAPDEGYPRED